ncbi:MAG: DDE-type integrase/transposase/recombinase, partial [Armatimonadota bacterium]|nr:DDE-type integrase/transposase/recombinase [Armatimonadota bacterium]
RIWALLRREGWPVNHKRVHRIWKEEGLDLRRRRRTKRAYGPKGEVEQRATHPDHVWTYDICEDRTERGGQLRVLSVVDEFTRECLAIEVARSISGEAVVHLLTWLSLTRGRPEHIRADAGVRLDNGSEFIARAVREWLEQEGCETIYITPGSLRMG